MHRLVTRASYFRRRCARRRAAHKTTHYVLTPTPRQQVVARPCIATVAVTVIAGHRQTFEVGVSGVSAGRVAEAKPTAPTARNRSRWFPMQTRPRRTQCGVGADDSFVTNAECERTRIPDAPLPVADRGARLAGASSRFLCLSFFAAAKKVSAAPHRGNTNRPLTNQGKAPKPEQGKPKAPGPRPMPPQKAKTSHLMPPSVAYRRQCSKYPTA
ncbi:hypothetical protein R20943_05235 [Paraburkholderia aspalathi]|nr:hypothetical protein R20943_05235 [Paraburkholderia aspalathi]